MALERRSSLSGHASILNGRTAKSNGGDPRHSVPQRRALGSRQPRIGGGICLTQRTTNKCIKESDMITPRVLL